MGDNISVFKYVQSRMRSHFLKCYQLQKLLLFSMQGEAVTRCRNTCLYYFQSIATMLPAGYDTTMSEWFVPSINGANVLRPVTVANYISVSNQQISSTQKNKRVPLPCKSHFALPLKHSGIITIGHAMTYRGMERRSVTYIHACDGYSFT